MSKTSVIAVRIDPDTKKKVEKLYASFGLTISDAINIFIHQSLNVKGLPFELREPVIKGELDFESGTVKETTIDFDAMKNKVGKIAKKYGVERVYLFGSRARGDNRPDSDYDFSIDPGKLDNLIRFIDFSDELEKELGCKVDVISRKGMKDDLFKRKMIDEEVLIYEC